MDDREGKKHLSCALQLEVSVAALAHSAARAGEIGSTVKIMQISSMK